MIHAWSRHLGHPTQEPENFQGHKGDFPPSGSRATPPGECRCMNESSQNQLSTARTYTII